MQLSVRLLSGELLQIDEINLNDTLAILYEKVAKHLKLHPSEIRLCHGVQQFSLDKQCSSLETLGITNEIELALLRVPRLTLSLLEGNWVNSKGAKIVVSGADARVSGMVTYQVKVDGDGTVYQVENHLHVTGMSGADVVHFQEDTWWRAYEDDSFGFPVTCRTVGGDARRIEDLKRTDTLLMLKERVCEAFGEDLDANAKSLTIRCDDGALVHHGFDNCMIYDLGVRANDILLCIRNSTLSNPDC
mmetsp:Transcript_45103/g.81397  ORF Transcript_45103/g.81397 Transcript_45103/m.81397 type:complete len:246 (-) Transcript_45103:104-841(-)